MARRMPWNLLSLHTRRQPPCNPVESQELSALAFDESDEYENQVNMTLSQDTMFDLH